MIMFDLFIFSHDNCCYKSGEHHAVLHWRATIKLKNEK